jgi:hypothetical protein
MKIPSGNSRRCLAALTILEIVMLMGCNRSDTRPGRSYRAGGTESRIETLESELNEMKSQVTEMESQTDDLERMVRRLESSQSDF